MAIIPTGTALVNGTTPQVQPSLTWGIDQETKRITGEVDGLTAAAQAVAAILQIERFSFQIYKPYTGTLFSGLVGLDAGYVMSELQRRITDALLVDDRIKSVDGFVFSQSGSALSVTFSVSTVYGDTTASVEVQQ